MNLFEFIQYKKLGHTKKESFVLNDNVKTTIEKILIKEKDIETFKRKFKNASIIIKGNDEKIFNNLNKAFTNTIEKVLDLEKDFAFNYQFSAETGVLIPYHGSKKIIV